MINRHLDISLSAFYMLREYQKLSDIVREHQSKSENIRHNQSKSENIRDNQNKLYKISMQNKEMKIYEQY